MGLWDNGLFLEELTLADLAAIPTMPRDGPAPDCPNSECVPMSAAEFDRDEMARWYATQHLNTDPGIRAIYYLHNNSPEREIRFIEINGLIAQRNDCVLEPIDFGVDMGSIDEHKLFVLDVTPDQWDRIERGQPALPLPHGWTLTGAKPL